MKTFLIYVCVIGAICAQSVSGKVRNSKGEPMEAVMVYLEKSSIGTSTNEQGIYHLEHLPHATNVLIAKMIGYETYRFVLKQGENTHDIVLHELNDGSETVIVSASRVPEPIDEVPVSVTVIGVEKIEEHLGFTSNINEVLEQLVPGIAPSSKTTSNWGQTLRGRKALVMIDGVPQSTPLRNGQLAIRTIDGNSIERVEVIKGATAIYGNGGDGGIINYITKRPELSKEFAMNTKLSTRGSGSHFSESSGYGINTRVSGSLQGFRYFVNLGFEQSGVVYDSDGDPLLPTYGLGETQSYNLFGKLAYDINEHQQFKVTFGHYFSRQDTKFIDKNGAQKYSKEKGFYLEKAKGVLGVNLGKPQGPKVNNLNINYTVDNLFSDKTRFNIDAYSQNTENVFFYSEKFKNGGQSVIISDKLGVRPYLVTTLSNATFTYGIDALNDRTSQDLIDRRVWVPEIDMVNIAPYVQIRYKITSDLTFKGGFRYDNISLTIDDYSTLEYSPKGDGVFNPSLDVTGGNLSYTNSSLNIGLRYSRHPEFNPYISFSQGFSLPDMGGLLRDAKTDHIKKIHIEAITTNNVEFGFTSQLKRMAFEIVGYYSTSNLGTGLMFSEENNRFEPVKAPQNIFGFEISSDFKISENILFGSAFTFVEGLQENEDQRLSYIGGDVIAPPKLNTYLNILMNNGFDLRLNHLYVAERRRFSPNSNGLYAYREAPVRSYNVLNAAVTYRFNKGIQINLSINNVLNERYFPARSQWSAPLSSTIVQGEGLNFKLTTSLDF